MLFPGKLNKIIFENGEWIICRSAAWAKVLPIVDASDYLSKYIGKFGVFNEPIEGSVAGYIDIFDGRKSWFLTVPVLETMNLDAKWGA
jgi:hypothetical protein